MNKRPTPLFRKEAVQHHSSRLQGNIVLSTPLTWQLIGYLFLATLLTAAGYLWFSSYSRVETVDGVVALDQGVAAVVPSRAGVIQSLNVVDGETVRAGQVLARVRSEESMISGDTFSERVRTAIDDQDATLQLQVELLRRVASAERAQFVEIARGLEQEIASLDRQIVEQVELIESAKADLERAQEIAKRGFISKRDIDLREMTLRTRRQQLEQIRQAHTAKRAKLAETNYAIAEARANSEADIARAEQGRAVLQSELAQSDLVQGYDVTATVDGAVTSLSASVGQAVLPDQQLMMILPDGAKTEALLYVPTAAAGFLRRGQEVRLAVDAFPYQTFGTIPAEIREISRAAVMRQGIEGSAPVFIVKTSLRNPWMLAFGERQPLFPGMTLTARIVTERRSLFEWLFEPVLAVRRR